MSILQVSANPVVTIRRLLRFCRRLKRTSCANPAGSHASCESFCISHVRFGVCHGLSIFLGLFLVIIIAHITKTIGRTQAPVHSLSRLEAAGSAGWLDKEPSSRCEELPSGHSFILVWAFDAPPSPLLLERSLHAIARTHPNVNTRVLCASEACLHLAKASRNNCVMAELLILPQLMVGSPLETWAREHVLMKLLSAHLFEEQLQFLAQLAALWRYGGVLLAPGVFPTNQTNLIRTTSWIASDEPETDNRLHLSSLHPGKPAFPYQSGHTTLRLKGSLRGFYAMSARPEASFVHAAMEAVWDIARKPYSPSSWPVAFDWDSILSSSLQTSVCDNGNDAQKKPTLCVTIKSLQELGLSVIDENSLVVPDSPRNFGTLAYNARRTYLLTRQNPGMNIGDEMQGLAGIQFLPYVNAFVERDRLDVVRLTKDKDYNNAEYISLSDKMLTKPPRVTVFLNAWFASSTWVWPPPDEIDPILVAMHFEEGRKERVAKEQAYLIENGPIGARDQDTDGFLKAQGVSSVFAGCLTLTMMPLDPESKDRKGEILIVDVSKDVLENVLPRDVIQRGVRLSHKALNRSIVNDRMARYYDAFAALRRYSHAKLVVTQRLHVALPSAAMGVPVVFLKSNMLPGGGRKSGQSRLRGLDPVMHTFDISDPKTVHILSREFNWNNPSKNPGEDALLAFRNKLLTLVMCHEGIRDSAKKFGVVPVEWKAPRRENVCDARESDRGTIHIAVTLDRKWISMLPTWLNAIVQNNEGERMAFHFLTDSIKPSVECIITEVVRHCSQAALVFFHKADHLLDRMNYRPSTKHRGKISRVTQARLYLSSLLPCLDRVLYLDMDALVLQNLRQLWGAQIDSSCGIMGRTSTRSKVIQKMASHLNIPPKSLEFPSFNAGVMLLDLHILRELQFERRIVSYFAEEIGANDQIVYNLACNGTHDEMPVKWNAFEPTQRNVSMNATLNDWGILHFAGSVKPFLRQNTVMTAMPSFQLWKQYETNIADLLEAVLT